MFNFHKDHQNLVATSLVIFVILSILIAIVPAVQLQGTQPLPAMKPMTDRERKGLFVYTSENCMSCHTQQVRNIEMDKVWGERPSMASDYYYSKQRLDFWRQSPSLLGSERTGPDLTSVGNRQAGKEWHLLHLYNPRIVVSESIMPAYPWLFTEKKEEDVREGDVVVPVPESFYRKKGWKIVATEEALSLTAYLISLKQAPLQEGESVAFIASKGKPDNLAPLPGNQEPNGEALYISTCSACHQKDGKGLPGAFPPLAGSPIVNNDDPETLIRIILQGYDARAEYGVMAGFAQSLSDEQVSAIANHERSSWGNKARTVTAEEVKKIRNSITASAP